MAEVDQTQFERLKAIFDEIGVDYHVYERAEGEPARPGDFMVQPGEKWLVVGTGYFVSFDFATDGRFLRYAIFE
jgi:hypothetical protein